MILSEDLIDVTLCVRIPFRDLTGVTLVSDDTYEILD